MTDYWVTCRLHRHAYIYVYTADNFIKHTFIVIRSAGVPCKLDVSICYGILSRLLDCKISSISLNVLPPQVLQLTWLLYAAAPSVSAMFIRCPLFVGSAHSPKCVCAEIREEKVREQFIHNYAVSRVARNWKSTATAIYIMLSRLWYFYMLPRLLAKTCDKHFLRILWNVSRCWDCWDWTMDDIECWKCMIDGVRYFGLLLNCRRAYTCHRAYQVMKL